MPQFLAVGVKNLLLFGYGMTLGFPTIVIPAIQGGDGHYDEHPHDIVLNKEEISWFSNVGKLKVEQKCKKNPFQVQLICYASPWVASFPEC